MWFLPASRVGVNLNFNGSVQIEIMVLPQGELI